MYIIIWLVLWVGKVNQILHCDRLPKWQDNAILLAQDYLLCSAKNFPKSYITAPFNNMQTLKFKAQPTNAFFATINQVFGGSSQLLTTAERAAIKSLSKVQTMKQCSAVVGSWEESLNIWLTVVKNAFVCWALNFRVHMWLKGAVIINPLLTKLVQSRWLDISFVLFLVCWWTSTPSWSINTQKKNWANIQPSWHHSWSITHTWIYFFSRKSTKKLEPLSKWRELDSLYLPMVSPLVSLRSLWLRNRSALVHCYLVGITVSLSNTQKIHYAVPENIHTSPTEGFFSKNPHPSGNSYKASHISLKFLVLQNPPPPRKFQSLLWG